MALIHVWCEYTCCMQNNNTQIFAYSSIHIIWLCQMEHTQHMHAHIHPHTHTYVCTYGICSFIVKQSATSFQRQISMKFSISRVIYCLCTNIRLLSHSDYISFCESNNPSPKQTHKRTSFKCQNLIRSLISLVSSAFLLEYPNFHILYHSTSSKMNKNDMNREAWNLHASCHIQYISIIYILYEYKDV